MGRHHCKVCWERDIETCVCEKCGAGEDCDLCGSCAERCCMPQGTKNREYDTDLVKRMLRDVKTTSLAKVLADWVKKHTDGDNDPVHTSDSEKEDGADDSAHASDEYSRQKVGALSDFSAEDSDET
jgi:hypothetical protein